jgi:hypothetical protein
LGGLLSGDISTGLYVGMTSMVVKHKEKIMKPVKKIVKQVVKLVVDNPVCVTAVWR